MADRWYKKIWFDPVLSKVISVILLSVLSYIGYFVLKLTEINKNSENVNNIENMVIEFVQNYYKDILIIILTILLLIFIIYYLKEKYFNKKYKTKIKEIKKSDIKWLINIINSEAKRYMFLLWYPVHGQISYDVHLKIADEDKAKLISSKTFNELKEKGIIHVYHSQWTFEISINEEIYNVIDNHIKANFLTNDDMKDFINGLKNAIFETTLYFHIYTSDYKNM